jgi:hypothetical protein
MLFSLPGDRLCDVYQRNGQDCDYYQSFYTCYGGDVQCRQFFIGERKLVGVASLEESLSCGGHHSEHDTSFRDLIHSLLYGKPQATLRLVPC